jgi:predicted 3-demethylubiquinone-9 3-methyltransferase (glyoxalase superfamily)
MASVQKITPYLWFTNNNSAEAMEYYCNVFPNSRVIDATYYPEGSDDPHLADMNGKILNGTFELNGQRFMCIDGGSYGFDFNSAISFLVTCDDQAEIDYYWEKLSAKPEEEQCGWCTDRFGLRWQVVPEDMGELIQTPAQMQAMMNMKKIVIADLEQAK